MLKICNILVLAYFITAILFLWVSDGIGRYFLNLFLLFFTFLIIYVSDNKSKKNIFVLFTFFYVVFILLSIYVIGKTFHASAVIVFYSSFFISYVLVFDTRGKEYQYIFYYLFYIITIFVFFSLLLGVEPENIFSGSRNAVSLVLITIGSVFILDTRIERDNPFWVLLYFIILLSCVMAMGRSGMIASSLLFLASISYVFKRLTIWKLLFLMATVLLLIIFFMSFYNLIYDLSYFDYLKNKGMDGSYRKEIITEYLNSLTFESLLLGVDISSLPVISFFNGNPHNSFLFLHSNFGVIFLFVCACLVLYLAKVVFTFDTPILLTLIAFSFRASTDSASSITMFPFLFIVMLFFHYLEKNYRFK